jgi:3-oxoacyl-[acyl-carrier-protein] synthase-3
VLVIVAPGQGSQTPGFLAPWLELPGVADRLSWLSAVAGLDLITHGTTSDAGTIRDTAVAQPLIVAGGLVSLLALFPHPGDAFSLVGAGAGHSVGEITAAAAAGVITAEQAMVLVRERGRAMAEAARLEATGMSAVVGGDPDDVAATLARHDLVPANVNGAGQVVAAGRAEALAALSADPPAKTRVVPLAVAGAFHTPFMAPAVSLLNRHARAITTHDPRVRLVSNADGTVVHDGREVLRRIVAQVSNPVRWDLCMETLRDLGVTGLIGRHPGEPGQAGAARGRDRRAEDPRGPARRPGAGPHPWHSEPADRGAELAADRLPDQGPGPPGRPGPGQRGGLRRDGGPGRGPSRAVHRGRRARRDGGGVAGRGGRSGLPRSAADAPAPGGVLMSESGGRIINPLLAPSGSPHARILSVGAHRPERVVSNEELIGPIDSSDSWIRERSGIRTRRWATAEETVIDLAEPAARTAIERSGLDPSQIDTVLVATITHLHQTPSAAALLAHRLGATHAAAMDISAACAGFCYGISLATDMIRGGSARHVLVIGVEKLSDLLDGTDRSTAFIFGDGAGAVVVGPSPTPAIGPTVWGSDGSQWQAIRQSHSWIDVKDGAGWPTLRMVGPAVFRWAVWEMAPVAARALKDAGITADDLAAFIPHQANMRIIDAMAKQLQLPDHVAIARDIADTGNTSAASIPLAMDRMLAEGQVPSGGLALLIGFGAGLTYAAQVVELP